MEQRKVIIVEGKTDRERLLEVLDEPVTFVLTHGTLSQKKIEEHILPLEGEEVYIFVDADESGMKLRKELKELLPNAKHLYTRKSYQQVANTPLAELASILNEQDFLVKYDSPLLNDESSLI